MAGHSHWAGIKHKKKIVDAKKGKLFSKLAKQVSVAARHGGGDPNANLALKYAIERARAGNMPKDKIERAIKKGTGEIQGESYEEVVYEGYGPGGVAVLLGAITDNRNRTSNEIKKLFERYGGSVGKTGCVAWQFEKKAFVLVTASGNSEDAVMEAALEGGAEDVEEAGGSYEITGDPSALPAISEALAAAEIETESAEVANLPSSRVAIDPEDGRKVLALLQALDDHDDVQSTDTNLDITDDLLAAVEELQG
ncbi:MAG: YebC/PmpR family DNA-binding transcriptional regulator [Planctomycetota bacterium]|jgi:YebC/PmpR family DNA-binding regulatory protein